MMNQRMSDCDCSIEAETREQGRVLWALLAVNAIMFVAELTAGILAESTGLIADSLDMLSDAAVYAIGLYAVGGRRKVKIRAASISGYFQVALAIGVAVEIGRRLIRGSEPEPSFMIGVGILALIANVFCLALISKHRNGEVHMRASWIFSRNDVIANAGVIIAAVLVYALDSRLPDLLIGTVIVLVVLRGGFMIIGEARDERERITGGTDNGS